MSTTPKGVTITAKDADGNECVITEGVQVLYDHVIQSMDWGSGFLTIEDVAPIVDLAQFCGFNGYEEAEEYMESKRVQEKQRNCKHPRWNVGEPMPDRFAPGGLVVKKTCVECGLTLRDHRYLPYLPSPSQ